MPSTPQNQPPRNNRTPGSPAPLLRHAMKAVPLAALAATAAVVLSLHAQDSENPAAPEPSPATPDPTEPAAKPYLVIDALPTSPDNAGNGSSDRLGRLEAQLNQAAVKGYRLAAAHQDWIIMAHSSATPSKRRVILPVGN